MNEIVRTQVDLNRKNLEKTNNNLGNAKKTKKLGKTKKIKTPILGKS